jgi:hypothetical protein
MTWTLRLIILLIGVLPFQLSAQEVSSSPVNLIRTSPKVQDKKISVRYPDQGIPTAGQSSVEFAGNGATYPLTYIDGCDKTHNIGFKFHLESELACDAQVRIHPHAVRFLNKYMHECTIDALKKIGVNKPIARVDIHSQGVFVYRHVDDDPNRDWSNHALGAAIDMNQLEVEFEDGSKVKYPVAAVGFDGKLFTGFSRCQSNCKGRRYNRTGKALFYDGFKNCIEKRVEDYKNEKESEGLKCTGGVLGCDYNSDHANHIHLSVPICPAPKGVAGI